MEVQSPAPDEIGRIVRNKLSQEEKDKRLDARWKIIRTANNHRMNVHADNPYIPKLLGMKNINEAVFCVRQGMLIDGKTLMQAGFKAHAAKPGKPTILKRLIGER